MSLTKEELIQEILHPSKQACEDAGISLAFLIKKAKSELKAKTVKHYAHQGVVMDERTYIDWSTRQTARQDLHKIRGDYPAERHDHNVKGAVTVIFQDPFADTNGTDKS